MFTSARKAALIPAFLMVLFCISCGTKKTEGKSENKYSFYILGKDGKEYIIETNKLDSSVILPEVQGSLLNSKELDRDIIVKNGSYYHLNRRKGLFYKYRVQDGTFQEVASVPLKDFSIENYNWAGKDSLLLTGLDLKSFKQARYALIQVDQMKVLKQADLKIPLPAGKFNSMSLGFAEPRGKHMFIGYTYHHLLSASNYTTSDTTYIAELHYPEMQLEKIEKDTRSTYPGGTNIIQSYTFTDEQQDYYFMSCPGIALGNRPDLPTGIFRIKAAADHLDKDYFLNISGSIVNNHAYGMWYLGNHQAIIRTERKDLFKGLSDHYSTAHFEFYIVDLTAEKVVKKLDLPLDKGTRRECVIVKGDTAYIAVNSTKKGNFIWVYNIKTGSLKKGLQLAGNTDFIMRMDRLNP